MLLRRGNTDTSGLIFCCGEDPRAVDLVAEGGSSGAREMLWLVLLLRLEVRLRLGGGYGRWGRLGEALVMLGWFF